MVVFLLGAMCTLPGELYRSGRTQTAASWNNDVQRFPCAREGWRQRNILVLKVDDRERTLSQLETGSYEVK